MHLDKPRVGFLIPSDSKGEFKLKMSLNKLAALISFAALFGACGPMNTKPPGSAAATVTPGSVDPSFKDSISFSKNHQYVIVVKLLNGAATMPGKPQKGDNIYEVWFYNADMTPVPANFEFTGEYFKTKGKTSTHYPAKFDRQADGGYKGTLKFSKGSYTIHFNLKGQHEDEHAIIQEL